MFPRATVNSCFFHFSQAIYRRIQAEGLQQLYSQDQEFAMKARMLAAIAFVPEDDVDAAFHQLPADLPEEVNVGHQDLGLLCGQCMTGLMTTFPAPTMLSRDGTLHWLQMQVATTSKF